MFSFENSVDVLFGGARAGLPHICNSYGCRWLLPCTCRKILSPINTPSQRYKPPLWLYLSSPLKLEVNNRFDYEFDSNTMVFAISFTDWEQMHFIVIYVMQEIPD